MDHAQHAALQHAQCLKAQQGLAFKLGLGQHNRPQTDRIHITLIAVHPRGAQFKLGMRIQGIAGVGLISGLLPDFVVVIVGKIGQGQLLEIAIDGAGRMPRRPAVIHTEIQFQAGDRGGHKPQAAAIGA